MIQTQQQGEEVCLDVGEELRCEASKEFLSFSDWRGEWTRHWLGLISLIFCVFKTIFSSNESISIISSNLVPRWFYLWTLLSNHILQFQYFNIIKAFHPPAFLLLWASDLLWICLQEYHVSRTWELEEVVFQSKCVLYCKHWVKLRMDHGNRILAIAGGDQKDTYLRSNCRCAHNQWDV